MKDEGKIEDDFTDWSPCEAGEVHRMVDRLRAHRRNRNALKGMAVALLLVTVGVLGTWVFDLLPPSEPTFGGIACSEVHQLGEQYMMGTLDEATMQKIRAHLEECPECRRHLEQTHPTTPADARSEAAHHRLDRVPVLANLVRGGSQQSSRPFLY